MKTLLTLCCVLIAMVSSAQSKGFDERRERADSFHEAKMYTESLDLYNELLTEDPKNRYTLSSLGVIYFEQQNYKKAREMFALATLYCPVGKTKFLSTNYSNLSAAYSNLNEDKKAYEFALKAYRLNEESPLALWNAASLAQNEQRYDECLAIMNNAKIEKNNAFNTLYSRCYFAKEDYEKAVEYGELWLKDFDSTDDFVPMLVPDDEKSRLFRSYLGVAKEQTSNQKKKNEYFEKALHLLKNKMAHAPKSKILELFSGEKNLYSYFDFPKEWVEKSFTSLIKNPNSSDSASMYFTIKDYAQSYRLAASVLADREQLKNELISETYKIEYISYINLLAAELKSSKTIEPSKIRKARNLYEHFFEKDTDYEAINVLSSTMDDSPFKVTAETFEAFNNIFKSKAEQKIAAPYVFEIVKNTPNKKFRASLTEMLNFGALQN